MRQRPDTRSIWTKSDKRLPPRTVLIPVRSAGPLAVGLDCQQIGLSQRESSRDERSEFVAFSNLVDRALGDAEDL